MVISLKNKFSNTSFVPKHQEGNGYSNEKNISRNVEGQR